MKNADMPAMPITLQDGEVWCETHDHTNGLTKREYFSAMAMQGLLNLPVKSKADIERIPSAALEMADALLEALDND